MNLHFLSFIFDILSWAGIGFYFGYVIAVIEKKYNRDTTSVYLITTVIAIGSGLLFSLNAALPTIGFALDIFFETLAATLVLSAVIYKNFRSDFLDGRRWSL